MTKLHFVKKARKDYPKAGIKRGQPYWWYAHRNGRAGVKHRCATKPPPSRLARSPFLRAVLTCKEQVERATANRHKETLLAALRDAQNVLVGLRADCEGRASGMEPRFPSGCPSLELLRDRAEACRRLYIEVGCAAEAVENDETAEIDWTVE